MNLNDPQALPLYLINTFLGRKSSTRGVVKTFKKCFNKIETITGVGKKIKLLGWPDELLRAYKNIKKMQKYVRNKAKLPVRHLKCGHCEFISKQFHHVWISFWKQLYWVCPALLRKSEMHFDWWSRMLFPRSGSPLIDFLERSMKHALIVIIVL